MQENFFDTTVHDIPILKKDTTVLICSKRNSGKSKLVLNLIKDFINNYHFNYIVLFSDTAQFLDDYKFIDKKFIMPLENDRIVKILDYQEKQITNGKKISSLMLLDDITLDKRTCSSLNRVFSQGRHFNITIIMSVQYPKFVVSPIIRNNIDYCFLGELSSEMMFNLAKELFVVSGVSTQQIYAFIVANNNNFQFILYDNTEKDRTKRFMVVKAKLLELQLKNKGTK